MPQLSKTSYIKGLQCQKQLYLYVNAPEKKDPLTQDEKVKFAGGHKFEDRYRDTHFLFAFNVERQATNRKKYAEVTQQALQNGYESILEATFVYNNVLVMNDVLTKTNGQWELQEIKNSSELKPTHIQDIALQYYVTSGALKSPLVAKIVLPDASKGYQIIEVTAQVLALQNQIVENIEAFQSLLDTDNIPQIAVGEQCMNPYKCSFYGYCHR